jgi:hypothetical protein
MAIAIREFCITTNGNFCSLYLSTKERWRLKFPIRKANCCFLLATLAIAAGASLTANAAQTKRSDVKTQTQESDTQSVAYRTGYQDGWIAGEESWAHSGAFRMNSNEQYSKATHGYSEDLGDKNEYKRLYRKGFEEGYSVGYGQSAPSRTRRD